MIKRFIISVLWLLLSLLSFAGIKWTDLSNELQDQLISGDLPATTSHGVIKITDLDASLVSDIDDVSFSSETSHGQIRWTDLSLSAQNYIIDAFGETPTRPASIIYEETFEGTHYFPMYESGTWLLNNVHAIENCNETDDNGGDTAHGTIYDWTLNRVTDTIFQGSKAGRFEVDSVQPLIGSIQRVRSEVTVFHSQDDPSPVNEDDLMPDVWYSFAVYFPANGFGKDSLADEDINQWYSDGGSYDPRIITRNDRMWLDMTNGSRWRYDLFGAVDAARTSSSTTAANTFTLIPKDEWHEFVFHFIHSQSSGGLIDIWRDGVNIQTITGLNMGNSTYPKWKIGIYKSEYHPGEETESVQAKRVVFFDNIRVGNSTATFEDMTYSTPSP